MSFGINFSEIGKIDQQKQKKYTILCQYIYFRIFFVKDVLN